MKNRFNNLTSKEWLPFQKSWFRFAGHEDLYRKNIRFFTKNDGEAPANVFYQGPYRAIAEKVIQPHGVQLLDDSARDNASIQFAFFDLLESITPETTPEEYYPIKKELINTLRLIYDNIQHRRFAAILIPNIQQGATYYPYAWDLAKSLATLFSLKDEKIACLDEPGKPGEKDEFRPVQDVFYCLYFRKDERSNGAYTEMQYDFFRNTKQLPSEHLVKPHRLPKWFILKPPPRKKNEILHPAKYPEKLVEMFLETFTKEHQNVFDPMTGTGSTQRSALLMQRNGYGAELSQFFTDIAYQRCETLAAELKDQNEENAHPDFKILNKDAKAITKGDFPEIDYIITSPPYWDMLNMKGAENQAKRIKKGLQTNYSDNRDDLGNLSDYGEFFDDLVKIYFRIADLMKPKSYLTIVVKNIKKKGNNYPFAWDLAHKLQDKLILLPEVFWLQDDLSIAPYGYGNTFVSNTFHQYCLTFQKP